MGQRVKHNRQAILQFIIDYKAKHDGNSPSIREMMAGCGVPSSSNMQYILFDLKEQGLIRFGNISDARTIEVVGGQWTYNAL